MSNKEIVIKKTVRKGLWKSFPQVENLTEMIFYLPFTIYHLQLTHYGICKIKN